MSARILTLTGTVHPKAEIQAVSAANGTATFRWLDADENPVDSGGSVARFTPLEPDNEPGQPTSYPEVDDATLIEAIENPPAQTVPEFVAAAKVAVQAMLDARAQQAGYDGILSAASYAGESTGAFAAEGAAFQAWRSAVWAACYAALGSHVEGDPLPTMASFLAELPAYAAP